MNYYLQELTKVINEKGIGGTIKISGYSEGSTNWLNINEFSIPVLIAYLEAEQKRLEQEKDKK